MIKCDNDKMIKCGNMTMKKYENDKMLSEAKSQHCLHVHQSYFVFLCSYKRPFSN